MDKKTIIQKFDCKKMEANLDKDGNDAQSTNNSSVMALPCQDVQSAHSAFDDLLHSNSICVGPKSARPTTGHGRTLLK